jgi:putative tryptophan/tyrosine transport system substrate-binding protein
MIDRRAFLQLIASVPLAMPLAAEGQQAGKVCRVSFLALIPGEDVSLMKALKERLHELGYIEGMNLIFEYRSAEGRQERLTELATELARARPNVLIAGAGTLAPLALKGVTTTIPIVFVSVGDPVGAGVVASLARPGSNITGVTGQSAGLAAKRLQLLRDLIPGSQHIAVLMNPATPFALLALKETRAAAEILHVRLEILELKTRDQVAGRFEAAITAGAAGMIVFSDPLTYEVRQQISDLAAKFRLPTMYTYRDFAVAGGLISYGPSRREMYRTAAEYTDKILKGAKPADLPVQEPVKFNLIVNLRTARQLGITIPSIVLHQATRVIE